MTEKKKSLGASKKAQGRPTDYTLDKADQICEWYSNGQTLTACCRELGIGRTTLYRWMVAHPEFSERLARARELFADSLADECLVIADNTEEGQIVEEGTNDNGAFYKVKKADMIDHRKLKVDTRLKLLAKWAPARYGDKKQVDVNNVTPVQVVFKNDLED